MSEPIRKVEEAKLNSNTVVPLADQYGIDINEVLAFVKTESSFDPDAVGPQTKYGRAFGLMQLLESTAKDMGFSKEDLTDPEKNLEAGIKYLAWLRDKFNTDSVEEKAWAYHGGIKDYKDGYLGPKTKAYKKRILRNYYFYQDNPTEAAKAIEALEKLIGEPITKTKPSIIPKPKEDVSKQLYERTIKQAEKPKEDVSKQLYEQAVKKYIDKR